MARARKVAVIGAEGHKMTTSEVRVECFTWQRISKLTNLRDYDTVVIDLLGTVDENSRERIPWDDVSSVLNIRSTLGILQHGGEIVVIGDPRFQVPSAMSTDDKDVAVQELVPFLKWTGMIFSWDSAPGDTIHFYNDYEHRNFEEYMKKLRRWDYSLARVSTDIKAMEQVYNVDQIRSEGGRFEVDEDFFCQNRYRNGLAFILRLQIVHSGSRSSRRSREAILRFGPVVFLPKIEASEDETLTIVLRDICGVEASLPEPEWLSDYDAPGQKAVDEEIQRIRTEIESGLQRLRDAQKRRENIRTCLKLLYERERGLEPAVRDVLRGLGAEVEESEEVNKEDGWITVKVGDHIYEGILEIKSTRSDQFGEDGLKQLLDWIDRGVRLREKKYKGIFIGNSCVDRPLKERPQAFSANWAKSAELHQMCALKTEDLYTLHLLKSARRIDLHAFWTQVFETNGVFDTSKYVKMLKGPTDTRPNLR